MATVVNDRDVLLQAASPRYTASSASALLISASAPAFTVNTAGTPTPASIKFTAVRIGLTGAPTFTASDGSPLTVSGDEATLAYSSMLGNSITVTASVTEGGTLYSRAVTIGKVFESGTTFTWLKYADDAAGAGLSDDPTGKKYIGFATNKSTATESTNPADYTWSLIKGGDGLPAADKWMWVKYSDYPDGTDLYDVPNDSTVYIGIAVNKLTATESSVKTDYVWSRFKGSQGVAGTGQRGPGWFYAVGSAWSDATAEAATPGDTQYDDTVTISNGTVSYTKRWNGSSWVVPGAFMDGSLFVENSITAAKINANGLAIRDSLGNLILGAGSALDPSYAAAGTKNSEQQWVDVGGTGKPADNASADLVLIGRGVSINGNTLTRIQSGSGWGQADCYSKDSYTGGAFVTGVMTDLSAGVMIGLNSNADGDNDAHYTTINYAIYGATSPGGAIEIYEHGSYVATGATWAVGDVLGVFYDGSFVRYTKNGTELRKVAASPGLPMFFDSSFIALGRTITNVRFGPMSDNSAGVAAQARIENISANGILDRSEKPGIVTEWNAINQRAGALETRADAAGVSRALLSQRFSELTNYLIGLSPAWNDTTQDTAIDRDAFRTCFVNYHKEEVALQNALTAQAKSAADAAQATANTANNGLADKLSKSAASVLGAIITLQTGGALLAGDTTNGVYMHATGLVGVQNGQVKFSIPISGNPLFAGMLQAAFGTFGAVTLDAATGSFSSGQTAYDTGTGWWMGYVGGVVKFSIGTASGGALLWDGTTLKIRQAVLEGTGLGGPSLTLSSSPSTMYFTYGRNISGGNAGTITANASGTGPFTYAWTISGNFGGRVLASGNGYSSSNIGLAVTGGGAIGEFDWEVTCTVTDSKGLTATKSMIVTVELT